MSGILAPKQQEELNKAILQYLEPLLKEEGSIDVQEKLLSLLLHTDNVNGSASSVAATSMGGIIPNYLEKKWSTVLRLQKKIIDLESEVDSLKSALAAKQIDGLVEGADLLGINTSGRLNWLPKLTSVSLATLSTQIVTSLAIHSSLPMVLNGCSDGTLMVWNMMSDGGDTGIPEKVIRAHTRGVNRVIVSNDSVQLGGDSSVGGGGVIFATCSSDLCVKIWDSTFKHVRTLTGHDHTVSSIAFSKSQPSVLYSVSRDKSVKIWDLTSGICTKSFIGHSDWVRDIDVVNSHCESGSNSSTFGDFLLTCSNDQSVRLTHASSSTGLALLIGHSHVVERVKFLPPTSSYFIDKFIKLNPGKFPTIPQALLTNPIYKTLGYKYCISAGRDNMVKLWLLPPPDIKPHRDPMPSQYNNSQGWHLADFVGHLSWVKSIKVHPNGKYIFSAGDDKVIKIWDLSSLGSAAGVQCVRTLQGHKGFINEIDFAPLKPEEMVEVKVVEDSDADEGDDKSEREYEQLVNLIEKRLRCIFVSGGVDNSIRIWN